MLLSLVLMVFVDHVWVNLICCVLQFVFEEEEIDSPLMFQVLLHAVVFIVFLCVVCDRDI